MNDQQRLAYANHLNEQHPDTWIPGQWYPATKLDGGEVEIKRTHGKGRNHGSFLHVRKEIPLYIRNHRTGERTRFGKDYLHARINLATGNCTLVD